MSPWALLNWPNAGNMKQSMDPGIVKKTDCSQTEKDRKPGGNQTFCLMLLNGFVSAPYLCVHVS